MKANIEFVRFIHFNNFHHPPWSGIHRNYIIGEFDLYKGGLYYGKFYNTYKIQRHD